MLPASGWMSPVSRRMVVVLPAPFGPRNPYTTPLGTDRSSPARATCEPYRFWRPRVARASPSWSVIGAPAGRSRSANLSAARRERGARASRWFPGERAPWHWCQRRLTDYQQVGREALAVLHGDGAHAYFLATPIVPGITGYAASLDSISSPAASPSPRPMVLCKSRHCREREYERSATDHCIPLRLWVATVGQECQDISVEEEWQASTRSRRGSPASCPARPSTRCGAPSPSGRRSCVGRAWKVHGIWSTS